MPPTIVRSFSKINLGLRIGPPRADGFHHLTTLFQTVALHDRVTVAAERSAATEIALTASDPRVPCDGRNTVYRMVSAALALLGVTARVRLHLEKNLPPQGGMGAGSANAAAALLGLERQLGVALPPVERLRIAEQVGSDVPVFLLGGTVYAHNRGEAVVPYPDLPRMHCVVVAPGVGSSTPAAFRAWDARIARLTPEAAQDRLTELSRVYASAFTPAGNTVPGFSGVGQIGEVRDQTGASGVSGALDVKLDARQVVHASTFESGDLAGNPLLRLVRTGIGNDFEEAVFPQHPSLREITHALAGVEPASPEELRTAGPQDGSALVAMLSGSGSSLFGLYRTEADAHAAQRRVTDVVAALGTGTRTFVTHTVDREEYWRTMFEQ